MLKALTSLIPGGGLAVTALEFLTSRIGMVLLAATIAFWAGHNIATTSFEADNAKFRIEQVERDLAIVEAADTLTRGQQDEIEALRARNQEILRVIQSKAPSGDAGRCRLLSPDDVARLRKLR